jgi:hypothetical protein
MFLNWTKTGNKTYLYSITQNKHPRLFEFVLFMVFHSTFNHAYLINQSLKPCLLRSIAEQKTDKRMRIAQCAYIQYL